MARGSVVGSTEVPTQVIGSSIFGGGDDGTCTFDGVNTFGFASLGGSTYTLTRDTFLADMSVVAAGVTIATAGFRLFCNGKLTNNGTISCDGKPAAAGVGGGSSALGSLGIGTAGGNGRSGGAGVGSNGTNQSNGLQDAAGAGQCVGGAGGAAGGNAGGSGGTYTANVAGNGGANFLFADMTGFLPGPSSGGNQGLLAVIGGGSGGGGGASDNVGVTGGGGGGAAGVLHLCVYELVNNGTIRAKGGDGAAAAGAGGNGGGGGGGAGGVILSTSRFRSGADPVAPGGAGGAGFGAGSAGSAGAAGHVNKHWA